MLKVAAYILIPLIYAAIGVFTVFFVFKPYISAASTALNMLTVPSVDVGTASETAKVVFDPDNIPLPGGTDDEPAEETVNGRDIASPDIGSQYGILELVPMGTKSNLYYGDDLSILNRGVGQYLGSYMPGFGKPILIAGHNNTDFHLLGELKEGDIIRITTHYGVYEYSVTGTKLTTNTDASAFDVSKDEEELALYTCYPFNMLGLTKQRWFVYATKISGPKIVFD